MASPVKGCGQEEACGTVYSTLNILPDFSITRLTS